MSAQCVLKWQLVVSVGRPRDMLTALEHKWRTGTEHSLTQSGQTRTFVARLPGVSLKKSADYKLLKMAFKITLTAYMKF